MIQVLEYIMQHYALFLGSAILILLAIIGYYADKTNFGQGKNSDNKEKKETSKIENLGLADITGNNENNNDISHIDDSIQPIPHLSGDVNNQLSENAVIEESNQLNIQGTENLQVPIAEQVENTISQENLNAPVSQNINLIENTVSQNANDISAENFSKHQVDIENMPSQIIDLVNNTTMAEEKDDSLLNEEAFNKFNDEFNSILPKRELIEADLLSDIDDLELDKTQKLDLSDVPDLDDIELPKIKQFATDEQDIWKF